VRRVAARPQDTRDARDVPAARGGSDHAELAHLRAEADADAVRARAPWLVEQHVGEQCRQVRARRNGEPERPVHAWIEVDQVMAQARAAGATIVKEAQDTFYGGYAGYFQDLDGHLWEIAFNPAMLPEEND